MSLQAGSSTPERRSAADLQRILDSLIGDTGYVNAGDLPDVLAAYEVKHDLIILDPSEYEGLRALCDAHAEMPLGPAELFQFLSMIQKPQDPPTLSTSPTASPSKAGNKALSRIGDDNDQSTPTATRRVSHRVRSPSEGSGTSSDSEEEARARTQRQQSEPVERRPKPFPSSHSSQSVGGRPLGPVRKKTLSDPSRHNNSPLAMRVQRNGHAPPSSFGFARPSPASRRRRGSNGAYTSETEENSPGSANGRLSRSQSSQQFGTSMTSPTWSHRGESVPTSPISPGIDHTSFHMRAKSPSDIGAEDLQAAEDDLEEGYGEDYGEDDEVDEGEDVVGGLGENGKALDPRLSRLSTDSTTSLRTQHDKLQVLQKQNTDLTRKLKESERQLSLLGADNDRMVVDLERQLEEARHELAQKRKDDKELRGHELKQNIQISGLEADLANVQRSLEQSKDHRAHMQKIYDDQCAEAQRLRNLLRDRDNEIHHLEESLQEHEADEAKYTREIQTLEAEIKRIESDLLIARKAESVLETQKQENLQLKETIDRMRFDLDEARAAASSANKGSHGRSSTNISSAAGTMSRNLGDEINRRLLKAEVVDEEPPESEDGDSIVETIVTTQRRRKVNGRKVSNSMAGGEAGATVPIVGSNDEEVHEYADVGVSTDHVEIRSVIDEAGPSTPLASSSSPAAQDHPPAYTAQPDPINEKEVLDRAHPKQRGHGGDAEGDYAALVGALGMRCTEMEEKLLANKAARVKGGMVSPSRSTFLARHPEAAVISNIVQTTSSVFGGKASVYLLGAFAIGVSLGPWLLGAGSSDVTTFLKANDLARSTGLGEGFLPFGVGMVGLVGVGANALGRVPT